MMNNFPPKGFIVIFKSVILVEKQMPGSNNNCDHYTNSLEGILFIVCAGYFKKNN